MTENVINNDDLIVQMIGSNDVCEKLSWADDCEHSEGDGAFWNMDDDTTKSWRLLLFTLLRRIAIIFLLVASL
jgi:hypothetical protein